MEKKGQGLSLSTIILLLLGVLVLVFLVYGFSTGWGSLWERITGFAGGNSNIDAVRQACELACVGRQQYAFCSEVREIRFGEEVDTIEKVKENNVDVLKKIRSKSVSGTCDEMAKNVEIDAIDDKGDSVKAKKFPAGKLNVKDCSGLC